jgi:hypothetical protein
MPKYKLPNLSMECITLSIITVGYVQFFQSVVCLGQDIEKKGVAEMGCIRKGSAFDSYK